MTDIFWIIPLIPGLSALILLIFGSKLPKKFVSIQACTAVFASLVVSVISFIGLKQTAHEAYPLVKISIPGSNQGILRPSYPSSLTL